MDSGGNPFGNWAGVNNSNSFSTFDSGTTNGATTNTVTSTTQPTATYQSNYDAYGYQTSATTPTTQAVATTATTPTTTSTYYVAPQTGVSKTAPFAFAGLLTAGFLILKKRKAIFT